LAAPRLARTAATPGTADLAVVAVCADGRRRERARRRGAGRAQLLEARCRVVHPRKVARVHRRRAGGGRGRARELAALAPAVEAVVLPGPAVEGVVAVP